MNCKENDCDKFASFGREGDKTAKYCAKHKKDGMVDVAHNCCQEEGCYTHPSFNYKGNKAGAYCNKHKKTNMINVVSKRCKEKDCDKLPSFNYEDKKGGEYCKKHKKEGMVYKLKKRCAESGCNKLPSYNYKGKKNCLYCANHKKEGMITNNIKKCREKDCEIIPTFNYEGEKMGIYCVNHKKDKMVRLIGKQCIVKQCKTGAVFNHRGKKEPLYCGKHKHEDMVDIVSKYCQGQNGTCRTRANPKYKGYCAFCFANTFPDDPLSKNIFLKSKELQVRDYINKHFENFIHDKVLYTGHCDCTVRRRVDFRFLLNETLLCIEVDENQHKSYSQMNEQTRYNDLYMAYSGKWIYIRFNPDKYKDKDGKNKNPHLRNRLEQLKEEIEKQMLRIKNSENKELVERIYLYYDKEYQM